MRWSLVAVAVAVVIVSVGCWANWLAGAEHPYAPSEKEQKAIVEQEKRREKGAPIPAAQAASAMTLPQGFTATLFAGEPDLHQPIAFVIDHRGRLWVAENYSYPQWREKAKDRISIYEDVDGD